MIFITPNIFTGAVIFKWIIHALNGVQGRNICSLLKSILFFAFFNVASLSILFGLKITTTPMKLQIWVILPHPRPTYGKVWEWGLHNETTYRASIHFILTSRRNLGREKLVNTGIIMLERLKRRGEEKQKLFLVQIETSHLFKHLRPCGKNYQEIIWQLERRTCHSSNSCMWSKR